MVLEYKKCPYCKQVNQGHVGASIVFCCSPIGSHNECEMCGAKWKDVTKEVLVERNRCN